ISPRVRDVANAPWVDEMRGVMGVIWVAREAEYFCVGTGQVLLICPSCQLVACRKRQFALALEANQPAAERAGSPHERSDMRDRRTRNPDIGSVIRATPAGFSAVERLGFGWARG